MAAVSQELSNESSEDPSMRTTLGPQAVDQTARQLLAMCWMVLPPERRNPTEVDKEVRRIVERALKDFKEDADIRLEQGRGTQSLILGYDAGGPAWNAVVRGFARISYDQTTEGTKVAIISFARLFHRDLSVAAHPLVEPHKCDDFNTVDRSCFGPYLVLN
jgi:hypothetical protein